MLLTIDQITVDPKLNPRVAGLDIVKVAEYAEDMSAGDKFPNMNRNLIIFSACCLNYIS